MVSVVEIVKRLHEIIVYLHPLIAKNIYTICNCFKSNRPAIMITTDTYVKLLFKSLLTQCCT